MSVTLSLALNMRRMLSTNNLVRKMHACETMGLFDNPISGHALTRHASAPANYYDLQMCWMMVMV